MRCDLLRFGPHGADMAFLARLNQRLAGKPRRLAPSRPARPLWFMRLLPCLPPQRGRQRRRFPLEAGGGLASLAAVSAIAWNAAGLLSPAAAPQLAQAPLSQQVVVASPQGPMVRDARLEELLAAHKQLGGTSALQEPSGFLRNATFEMPRNAGR
jgi:sigma-E factor negative regulatory protein RseA